MQTEFTEGIIGIRCFRSDDQLPLYVAVRESICELSTWMTWCHEDYSAEHVAAFLAGSEAAWRQGTEYSFAIYHVGNGTLLGSVGLNQMNRPHNLANLGYWVRRSYTRQGIAPAAVRLAARFAFQELRLERLELLVPAGNTFSQRVAEKTGARKEGLLRNRLVLQGKTHDACVYSILAKDSPAANADTAAKASITPYHQSALAGRHSTVRQ